MADVFVSYAREDRDAVARLANYLIQQGLTVWWDLRLLAGDHVRSEILKEITNSRVVLVVWTRHSVGSNFVHDEADEARVQGKLVAIRHELLDPQDIPLGFRGFQATLLEDRSSIVSSILKRIPSGDPASEVSAKATTSSVGDKVFHAPDYQGTYLPAPRGKEPWIVVPLPASDFSNLREIYWRVGSLNNMRTIDPLVRWGAHSTLGFKRSHWISDIELYDLLSRKHGGFIRREKGGGCITDFAFFNDRAMTRLVSADMKSVRHFCLGDQFWTSRSIYPIGSEAHDRENYVATAASGRLFAHWYSGKGDGKTNLSLWDVYGQDRPLATLEVGEMHYHGSRRLAWAASERFVRYGYRGLAACSGEPRSGKWTVSHINCSTNHEIIRTIWHSSKDLLVTLSRGAGPKAAYSIALIDAQTNQSILERHLEHKDHVSEIAWSSGGRFIATGGLDHAIILWDLASPHKSSVLLGHGSGICSLAFSPDGQRLASSANDGNTIIWNPETAVEITRFSGVIDPTEDAAWSLDAKMIAYLNSGALEVRELKI